MTPSQPPGRSPSATNATRYHHGDLPDLLVSLALQHIEAEGTEKLSLRALAREAGVSATAPYRHFPTKNCLLAEIATRGFNELTARVAEAVTVDQPIEDRFLNMGEAYVQFAADNPIAYQLMFNSVLADFSQYDDLTRASGAAYQHVLTQLRELIAKKQLAISDSELGGIVWATVHGISSLILNKSRDMPESAPQRSIMHLRKNPRRMLQFAFSHLLA